MGMYDYINYEAPCPKCGEVIKDWQSKDGLCTLEKLEPYQVDNFYTSCRKCGTWIDAEVKKEVKVIVKKLEIALTYESASQPTEPQS